MHAVRCVAIVPTDSNCTANWDIQAAEQSSNKARRHSGATTVTECQTACEFDPRCIAIDWSPQCWITIDPNHEFVRYLYNGKHYHLVSRCNITAGQCFERILMLR